MAGRVTFTSASVPMETTNSLGDDIKPNLKRRFTLQLVEDAEDLAPVVGKAEEAMSRKRELAAVDHQIDPSRLPVSAVTRATYPLIMELDTSSNIGPRPSNDDEHVVFETDYGAYFAICDGHGEVLKDRLKTKEPQPGRIIAQLVAKSLQEDLTEIMKQHTDMEKAFKLWANQIHEKLPKKENAGTTLVCGFFDKITHKLYVINIGDSEIVVFREDEDLVYPIPMTPKNNWETPENEERVRKLYKPEEFAQWKKQPAKFRRFPLKGGVNISNTLGDHTKTYQGQTALTHTPDITVLQLKKGDFILVGCDGLFDYVGIEELIDRILQKHWNDLDVNLAELIAQYALKEKNSQDNVTVMTLRVRPGTNNVEVMRSNSTVPLSLDP